MWPWHSPHHKWSLLLFLLSLGRAFGCSDRWNTVEGAVCHFWAWLWNGLPASASCLWEASCQVGRVRTLRPAFWAKPTPCGGEVLQEETPREEGDRGQGHCGTRHTDKQAIWEVALPGPAAPADATWLRHEHPTVCFPTSRPTYLWADKHGYFKPLSFQVICFMIIDNWKICFYARKQMRWIFKALWPKKKTLTNIYSFTLRT